MNCSRIDWTEFMDYTNHDLYQIQTNLNETFHSIDLSSYLIQLQQMIELKLQDHVVSIASQQRKIARMHRQLSVATELLNDYGVSRENKTNNYITFILFGLIIGILYEKYRRL
jgi:hypothetical protein